jgi:hypothetical protein
MILDQFGFAFAPIQVKPRQSLTMLVVYYKVDSGANCTTISSKRLLELGYDEHWIKGERLLERDARPTLASGLPVDDCYEVILPEIRIEDCVGYNWSFVTSLSVPFRFLLGTDTMQFFNWTFDYEHWMCKFNLIPGKRRLLFNSQEQSIHSLDELEEN